jgi:hypothetical protein
MASGELPWSLASRIGGRMPETETLDVREGGDLAQVRALAGGRTFVVVVRDPLRHPWQRQLLALAAEHPAVVVDVGWPSDAPTVPTIRTRGVAPGLLEAAADLLCSSVPAGGLR